MYVTLNRARRVYPRPLLNGATALSSVYSTNSPSIDNLFEGFFNSTDEAAAPLAARFDVTEKGDVFEARIEIPGVAKEDIDVQVDGAQVRVKAESKVIDEKKEGERVLHSNRVSRSWVRTFTLPVEVAEDRAEAAYENGVLTLTLPKKEVVQPKRLAIK